MRHPESIVNRNGGRMNGYYENQGNAYIPLVYHFIVSEDLNHV
jgi:hypothetical protein